MRRAAKTDSNHADVVNALRRAGASAWSTPIGNGFPDVIAAKRTSSATRDTDGFCELCGCRWSYKDSRPGAERVVDGHSCPPGFHEFDARRTVLFEVKDGTLPPSKRKLRAKQEEFAAAWQGECYLVESPHAAVRIMFGKQRADSICPEGE